MKDSNKPLKFVKVSGSAPTIRTNVKSVKEALQVAKRYFAHVAEVKTKTAEKAQKIREYRREVSLQAAIANKRIARLEKNQLTDSPAYKYYLDSGAVKFGVKGKTYNEVQAEAARIKKFIEAKTSTIKGVNKYLKGLAKDTGLDYSNLKQLRKDAPIFFELASKIEQYQRTIENRASALGYQKIWDAINIYTKQEKINLSETSRTIEDMLADINKALSEYDQPVKVNAEWFKVVDKRG